MRVALVSPYSWTYPGGVTRHIEALAEELEQRDHEVRILAPYDPDDALSRRLHRGARPQAMDPPVRLRSLGRTFGLPANGAVSNITGTPQAVLALRRELREGRYDVVHLHEPVVPLICWDALMSAGSIPLVGTFHTYSENPITNGIAAVPLGARWRMNRLRVRIAVSEAAAWTGRRFYGGRYRIVPNGVHIPSGVHSAACEPAQQGDGWSGQAGDGWSGQAGDGWSGQAGDGWSGQAGDGWSGQAGDGWSRQEGDGWNAQARDGRFAELADAPGDLRILFIGQAVERKGLPVLLRAFEALREHVPATLTLVGASAQEVDHLILDDRGVRALGKLSDADKRRQLARADVLCAPSLHGESFGMVITEGLAAGTPVLASDIPGYRDVLRDDIDGQLVPVGDPLALAEALRALALDPARRRRMALAARQRAERFAWPHVAAEVLDCYEQALAVGEPATPLARAAVRRGLMPADRLPPVPPVRLPSMRSPAATPGSSDGRIPGRRRRAVRRAGLAATSLVGLVLGWLALERVGVTRVAASLLASKPGLLVAGLALMCAAMFTRAIAWHAILVRAPTVRRAKRRDAMQGTFIGVLMSATLPARLGEPSRALIVARRLGRARETLPVVAGTIVSQALMNLLALAILGAVTLSSVSVLDHHDRSLLLLALAPLVGLIALLLAPVLIPPAAASRSRRLHALLTGARSMLMRLREGLRIFRQPRPAALATALQLGAWTLQLASCWLLLMALGLDSQAGLGAAAAVLFAVNVTAVIPATPANVGIFQAACVAVLAGVYHVSTPEAIAYGIVLQAVEVTTALVMGVPALLNEGLSWRDVRLRTIHATPVRLPALGEPSRVAVRDEG